MALKYRVWLMRWHLKQRINRVGGTVAVGLLRLMRRLDRKRSADFAAWALRGLGPWLPEHRTGRANLTAAFPEKSAVEIERILAEVWDNLGRVAAEFAHMDRMSLQATEEPDGSDIEYTPETIARFKALHASGQPSLVFAAHLGNWEVPARVAAWHGLRTAVLYRPPNIAATAEAVAKVRAATMGTLVPSGRNAPFRLASLLEQGTHVGMLVDQHIASGVPVTFFGRPCKANPMLARLARHFDCPIHGTRAVRVDRHRFRAELTEAIAPVRDANGQIDVQGTMQAITSVIEGWVREHPGQWLWLHRRWR